MRVVVMGAGLLGVTTAYFLSKDGHDVTVIERQPDAGNETSFANAGLVCPGHCYPWASPAAPAILLRSLIRDDQALRLKLMPDLRMWTWLARFLLQCAPGNVRRNAGRRIRLAHYSQQKLHALVSETGFPFSYEKRGVLYIYRTPKSLDHGAENMRLLAECGLSMRIVNPDEVVAIEPALRGARAQVAGAIFCPKDESGDAHVFCRELARVCERRGVRFLYGTHVKRIAANTDHIEGVVTSNGVLEGDAYIIALGSYSPLLTAPIGVKLQIFPIKGYSMTIPVTASSTAPMVSGVDEDYLMGFSRFGARLRLTATAELAGYDRSHQPGDFRAMKAAAMALFPNGGEYEKAEYWSGLRPMTPDGSPVLGRAKYRNLFLNTGHGSLGWTMCCGSAQIVADTIAGREPEIELEGLVYE